jgi:toxin CcdB
VRQFDVVENLNPATRGRFPFVVVLQHDRIYGLSTVIVAPLTPAAPVLPLDGLRSEVRVSGQRYRVLVEQLAAVRQPILGRAVGSLEDDRYSIIRAIDLVFTGI